MNKCGATIAYDYFENKLNSNPGLKSNQEERMLLVPQGDAERINCLFAYIEDADLWKWKLPNSKAFTSGLGYSNMDYNVNSNAQLFDQVT